jgi:hypothetical protein
MKRKAVVIARMLTLVMLVTPLTTAPVAAQQPAPTKVVLPTDRTVLPIPEPKARPTFFAIGPLLRKAIVIP